jgi:hypothetical protein
MEHRDLRSTAGYVAASTTAAVHRRDHVHEGETCHPHVIEVVGLGPCAVAVCHDCDVDTGFIDAEQAADVAAKHRLQTA